MSLGARKRCGYKDRFAMASTKNIMTGVLLAPGPISTRLTVKNMSPAFKLAISKAKFLSAAKHLQDACLGSLVVLEKVSSQAHVFVKKPPDEMCVLLQAETHRHLCTDEEYKERFEMPTPVSVTDKMQQCLIEMGLVESSWFRNRKSLYKLACEASQSFTSEVTESEEIDFFSHETSDLV